MSLGRPLAPVAPFVPVLGLAVLLVGLGCASPPQAGKAKPQAQAIPEPAQKPEEPKVPSAPKAAASPLAPGPKAAAGPEVAALPPKAKPLPGATIPDGLPAPKESPWLKASLASLSTQDLPGGARLILKRNPDKRLAACEVCILGGASLGPAGKEGALALGLALLTRGAQGSQPGAFRKALEDAGAKVELREISFDALGLEIVAPAEALPALLEGLMAAMAKPAFGSEDFSKADWDQGMRDFRIRALRDSRDPALMAAQRIRTEVYGGHPYSVSPLGSPESLLALTRQDVAGIWKSVVGSDRIVISVAGNLELKTLAAALGPGLQALGPRGNPRGPIQALPLKDVLLVQAETRATGAYLRLDASAPSIASPDYPAYLVGLAILQDILDDEVRGDIPLAYGVSTRLSTAAAPSSSIIITRARSAKEAKAAVERAIKLAASGVCLSPQDGSLAKLKEALPSYKLRVLTRTYAKSDKGADLALRMARDLAAGGDGTSWYKLADRLAEVGAEDVQRVLRERLLEGALAWSVVAPAADLEELAKP